MELCGRRPRTSIIPGTAASTSSRNPLTSSEKSTSRSWNDFLQKAWKALGTSADRARERRGAKTSMYLSRVSDFAGICLDTTALARALRTVT
jgi:hypothetical protein